MKPIAEQSVSSVPRADLTHALILVDANQLKVTGTDENTGELSDVSNKAEFQSIFPSIISYSIGNPI